MKGGRHSSDLLLLGLAFAVVYSDNVLFWVGHRRGRPYTRWQIGVVALGAAVLMLLTVLLLKPFCPQLDWWDPAIYIGAVTAVRLFYWFGEAAVRWLFDL